MKNKLIYLSEIKQDFDVKKIIWTDRFLLDNYNKDISILPGKLIPELSNAINKVLKEFNTLDKIGIACLGQDEFEKNGTLFCDNSKDYKDLFLNFANHYIWIRFLPQSGDYNIYIKVYKK